MYWLKSGLRIKGFKPPLIGAISFLIKQSFRVGILIVSKVKKPFKTHWYNRKLAHLLGTSVARNSGVRETLEVITLDVADGVKPSGKPPVRIYLGTEAAQHRAERVFIWSIMKVRDPSRVYEIYLMNDIKGIERNGWKTGFTNYRYGIPQFAGNTGRAIYNDVDQIYLSDPAELFDFEMGDAGVLAISVKENSVMLIDCEKMASHWTLQDVQKGLKHDHFKSAMIANDLFGEMPGVWNNRDGEHDVSVTKCFHYTTLHTQPWRPFPNILRYQTSPHEKLWQDLEDEADEAGYLVFTKENPSRRFGELIEQYQLMHSLSKVNEVPNVGTFHGLRLPKSAKVIVELIADTGAKTILDYGSGKGISYSAYPGESEDSRVKVNAAWGDVKVICYDPGHEPFSEPYGENTDGVISTDVVEHIPAEDIGWVLDEMFSQADRFVYVMAANYLANAILPNGENAHCTIHDLYWWTNQMKQASKQNPKVKWVLALDSKHAITGKKVRTHSHSWDVD